MGYTYLEEKLETLDKSKIKHVCMNATVSSAQQIIDKTTRK